MAVCAEERGIRTAATLHGSLAEWANIWMAVLANGGIFAGQFWHKEGRHFDGNVGGGGRTFGSQFFPRATAKGSCLVGLQPGPRCLSRRLPGSCRGVAGDLPGKSRCIDLGPKPSKRLGRSLKKSKKHHTKTSVLLKATNTPLFLLDFL